MMGEDRTQTQRETLTEGVMATKPWEQRAESPAHTPPLLPLSSRSSWEDGGPPAPSPEGGRSHSPGGAGEEPRLLRVPEEGKRLQAGVWRRERSWPQDPALGSWDCLPGTVSEGHNGRDDDGDQMTSARKGFCELCYKIQTEGNDDREAMCRLDKYLSLLETYKKNTKTGGSGPRGSAQAMAPAKDNTCNSKEKNHYYITSKPLTTGQSPPVRVADAEKEGLEGVRNFKELRAKFQRLDDPPLPRPIKCPAGVSPKDDRGSTQPTQVLPNRKRLSSHHQQPLSYLPTGGPQPIKSQKMKSAQRGEIQKNSSSPGPPEKSAACPTRNSQKAAMPPDVNKSRTEASDGEKGAAISSFRYKLWNWEKVSSQQTALSPALHLTNRGSKTFHLEGQKTTGLAQGKPEKRLEAASVLTLLPQSHVMAQRKSPMASEASSSLLPQCGRKSTEKPGAKGSPRNSLCQPVYECELGSLVPEKPESRLPQTKPLPSLETLGPPPPKPSKPPSVSLQAFHRQPAAVSKAPKEATVKEGPLPADGADLEEPHNYDTMISYLSYSGNSVTLSAAGESAEATYEIEIEELQKPWKSFLHPELSPRPNDEASDMKEKELCESEPQKPGKDSHGNHPPKVVVYEETPGETQGTGVHKDRRSVPVGSQEAVTDITQNRLFPEDVTLTRHSHDKGGYVEALEVTKETRSPSTIQSDSFSEKTYDDVGCSREDIAKWDFSSSFTSDSEENSEETYEDIYKAKNSDAKTDVAGRAALRRLQQLFRKEKAIFRVKQTKSKENVSNGFSVSLPNLGPRSQDLIYDDVDTSEKEPKDEDKLKTWKAKFLTPKGKKGEKGSDGSKSFSPRNFFRNKKQNLKKNRMEKEEKLFRERFQYTKEIVVINRAVACSGNSRNGMFDLPITPGEQLEIIDTTEQNLVICRNSKGKYGYVLIDHLHFKHQG